MDEAAAEGTRKGEPSPWTYAASRSRPDPRIQYEAAPDGSRPCGPTREHQSDQPSRTLPRLLPRPPQRNSRPTNAALPLTRTFHIRSRTTSRSRTKWRLQQFQLPFLRQRIRPDALLAQRRGEDVGE